MTDEKEPRSLAILATKPMAVDLADRFGVDPLLLLETMVASCMPTGHSYHELVACLAVAKEHGLNPLTGEIYFMKTKKGKIQPIVSVDGWIRKCNEHPQFDGISFEAEKDDAGNITEMTCHIHRKDREHPISITEYMDECKKAGGPVWDTSPKRMMRNRTLCQTARVAFGMAGIMEPDEFEQWQRLDAHTEMSTPATRRPSRPAPPPIPFDDIDQTPPDDGLPVRNVEDDLPPETTSEAPTPADDSWPMEQQALFIDRIIDDLSTADSKDIVHEIVDANAEFVAKFAPRNKIRVAEIYQTKLEQFAQEAAE